MVTISKKSKILEFSNIIDLILILVMLSLITGTALLFTPSTESPVIHQTAEVNLVIHQVPLQAAELIQVSDRLSTGNNKVVIESAEIRQSSLTGTGEAVNTALRDIHVTLKGRSTISEGIIKFGGQEISIGRKYQLISENYNLTGVIEGITLH